MRRYGRHFEWQELYLRKWGKVAVRLVVVIDTLKAVEYISIDSRKVNPRAASGFSFTDSPLKRKSKQKLGVYERRKNTNLLPVKVY